MQRSEFPFLGFGAGLRRQHYDYAWISDHLCWTGVGGRNLHDLLPLPHTDEAVHWVSARIRQVQETLERTILIENVSSYMRFVHSTMSEWQFLTAVAEESDCGILLDINNVFVSAFNHRFDPRTYIESVPIKRVAQYHNVEQLRTTPESEWPSARAPLHGAGSRELRSQAWRVVEDFYKFGTDKSNPTQYAGTSKPRPWIVAIEGEVARPQTIDFEQRLRWFPLEKRIYLMRCVEVVYGQPVGCGLPLVIPARESSRLPDRNR